MYTSPKLFVDPYSFLNPSHGYKPMCDRPVILSPNERETTAVVL